MLKIRKEQMETFGKIAIRQFEDYILVHLQRDFVEQVKDTPEDALRSIIQKGISNAERYNITTEYNVERYIDLMFILSQDFDKDKNYKWAGDLLRNEQMPSDERINRIYYRLEKKQ